MIPPFKRMKMPDRLLQQFQTNTGAVLDPLGLSLLINAQVATFTAASKIPHGSTFTVGNPLGVPPRGVIPLLGTVDGLFGLVSMAASTFVAICNSDIPSGSTVSFLVF